MHLFADMFKNLDATTYFLVNSGVVIGATAAIFSMFGLLFGFFTWGRFKRRWLRAEAANESLKSENALLKRRVADQTTPSVFTHAAQKNKPQYIPVILPTLVREEPNPTRDPIPAFMQRSKAFCIWTENDLTLRPLVVPQLMEPDSAPSTQPINKFPQIPSAHSFTIWTGDGPFNKSDGDVQNDHNPSSIARIQSHPFKSELESSKARHDSLLGIIYDEPPKRGDDLTKIKGINVTCRNSLQAQGIYTYKQIAHWTPVQIGEFARRLSLDARIQIDRWIDQARELHAKKHGEQI